MKASLVTPVFLTLVGCASPAPAVVYAPAPVAPTEPAVVYVQGPAAPAERASAPPEPPPAPAAVGDCNARLLTRIAPLPGGERVDAVVQNTTDAPLRFSVPDACPAGVAAFEGLGTYDYYGACAMGACIQAGPPRVFTVAPGAEVVVASATLHLAGSACQPPLAAGTYSLGFRLPGADGLQVCAIEHGVLEVRPEPTTERPRPERAPPRPPRECPVIACGGCPGGYAPSRDGCPSCECAHEPAVLRGPSRAVRD